MSPDDGLNDGLNDAAEPPSERRNARAGLLLLGGLLLATAVVSYALRPADVDDEPARSGSTAPADWFTVAFADRSHGFTVRHSCNNDDVHCRLSLLTSDDGGKRWTERPLPDSVHTASRRSVRLTPLGPCALALDAHADDPYQVFRLYTDDCGEQWSRVPLRVDGEIGGIPPGGTLEPCRIEVTVDYCSRGVVVTLPESGRRLRLSTAPALEQLAAESTPLPDGSWWISGRDPGTGEWSVAVSRDDGRHWTVQALPELPDRDIVGVPVSGLDENLYATPKGGPSHSYGVIAVFHSPDNGETWQRTWHADSGREPAQMLGTAMATDDGVLITVEGIGAPDGWRSRDRGRTFGSPQPADALGTATRGRGGYLISTGGGTRWYRSPDATTWSTLAFPPD